MERLNQANSKRTERQALRFKKGPRTLRRFVKRPEKKPGTAPGTLVSVGDRKVAKSRITIIDYDSDRYLEKEITSIEEALPLKDQPTVTWINIDGLHDIELIEAVGRHFDIHPLTLEDIVNTGHRPKIEEFDDYIFIVFKMLSYDAQSRHIESEQVSLVLGHNFLISFQEVPGDILTPVRDRIKNGKGRIRKLGSDYLAYALLDAVIDHYFIILESFSEKIETLEQDLLSDSTPAGLQQLYAMKRDIIYLRKQVWPIREMLNRLIKEEPSLIGDAVYIFFNDVYDHTIHVIDTIESFRDVLSGLLDIYLSTTSNKMNEVMKVLTIMATIFIPLTFIAGIYGMNFEYMPELNWRYAYPVLWLLLILIFIGMVAWFKRKKWL